MASHHDNTEHNDYHFRAKKKEINKQQPFESSMTRTSIGDFDLSKYASWKKRWTHWFCNSERLPATEIMQVSSHSQRPIVSLIIFFYILSGHSLIKIFRQSNKNNRRLFCFSHSDFEKYDHVLYFFLIR